MAQDFNFQDGLIVNSDTLSFIGEQVQIGTGAGAKSLVLSNNAGAVFFNANPTGARSIALPDAGGTVALITGISAGGAAFTNGQLVASNLNGVSFGINGSTLTASVSSVPNMLNFPGRENNANVNQGAAAAYVVRLIAGLPMNLTAFNILANNSSNASKTASVSFGLYSINGSTATRLSSTSGTYNMVGRAANNVFEWVTIPTGTMLVTQGDYMVYMVVGASSVVSVRVSTGVGSFPAGTNPWFGDGSITNTTNPVSFHVSEVNTLGGNVSNTGGYPIFVALGS